MVSGETFRKRNSVMGNPISSVYPSTLPQLESDVKQFDLGQVRLRCRKKVVIDNIFCLLQPSPSLLGDYFPSGSRRSGRQDLFRSCILNRLHRTVSKREETDTGMGTTKLAFVIVGHCLC
jgi:hypothetical protein